MIWVLPWLSYSGLREERAPSPLPVLNSSVLWFAFISLLGFPFIRQGRLNYSLIVLTQLSDDNCVQEVKWKVILEKGLQLQCFFFATCFYLLQFSLDLHPAITPYWPAEAGDCFVCRKCLQEREKNIIVNFGQHNCSTNSNQRQEELWHCR